jgi:hypothetical protein
MRASIQIGDSAYGIPLVKLTLTYDGELPSSGNKPKVEEVWRIRKEISPQLAHLWQINRALKHAAKASIVPIDRTFGWGDSYHLSTAPMPEPQPPKTYEIDLCAPISKEGVNFLPLVRNSFALMCSLTILFLRQEPVGRVSQGGDLDGRIKALIDALKIPDLDQIPPEKKNSQETIYCLLEDDALVTGIDIQTRQLLSRPGTTEKEVRLVIDVDVRVVDTRVYNTLFLGD